MTEEQISAISIGQAFMWRTADDRSSPRTEELATAYHVHGLPTGWSADVTKAVEKWRYELRPDKRSPGSVSDFV